MAEKGVLTIFGAAGATGRRAVDEARAAGWHVRAVEVKWPADAGPAGDVERYTADVLKDDLRPMLRGADAVISALGVGLDPATLLDPPPLYTEGTLRIVKAMQAERVQRLVVISASFVETWERGPTHFRVAARTALRNVVTEMVQMERILRATETIEWTAVRPGWLMDGPKTGDCSIADGAIPADMIRTRHADLAAFMVRLAGTRDWVRGTPAIARPEPEEASSPQAVLRELSG